jgi:branched-chain amino acid transport system substrate-binding protein
MDLSGATSDVGTAFSQGINDSFAWVNAQAGSSGRQFNISSRWITGIRRPGRSASTRPGAGSGCRHHGLGTADTEALVKFVTRDRNPYVSGL